MQHSRKRKFGRVANQRRALAKSMASSFFMRGRITTTEAKAKELRPYVEKFVTRAKLPSVANRRFFARFFSPGVVAHIIANAEHMKKRTGGYTRIIKTGVRKSDSARMAILEFVK